MAVTIDGAHVVFDAVIYEDEVQTMRDYFQTTAPEKVTIDFSTCNDVHLAVLQTIMAYKKLYACEYTFGPDITIFQKVLEGFDPSENHCN